MAELALYNGMLAGISLDGESFFYENPLEVDPKLFRQNQRYIKARDHMPEIQNIITTGIDFIVGAIELISPVIEAVLTVVGGIIDDNELQQTMEVID